jgi:DNA-binding NarL/FixJ family response regulator
LTKIIKEKYPNIEIIMQTVNEENNIIISSIEAGCSGYLLKTSTADEIRLAINIVQEGGSFLTGKIARKILQRVKVTENTNAASKFGLTQREKDILDELVRGAKNKEIAAKYDITTHTVNMHLRNVYIKMQVNSRSEAISKALKS